MHLVARGPRGLLHETHLRAGEQTVLVRLFRHPRARRYILRLRSDGTARITVPRNGSVEQALQFAARYSLWLERQFQRRALQPPRNTSWEVGSSILFRGKPVLLEAAGTDCRMVCFDSENVRLKSGVIDARSAIEDHLWGVAKRELPPRVLELASARGLRVAKVCVRNQRSRWGSCSRHGTISLNWRLVQTPDFVRDYIIYHELAHLNHLNHSARFWHEVERLCPGYLTAEMWLKQNSALLR